MPKASVEAGILKVTGTVGKMLCYAWQSAYSILRTSAWICPGVREVMQLQGSRRKEIIWPPHTSFAASDAAKPPHLPMPSVSMSSTKACTTGNLPICTAGSWIFFSRMASNSKRIFSTKAPTAIEPERTLTHSSKSMRHRPWSTRMCPQKKSRARTEHSEASERTSRVGWSELPRCSCTCFAEKITYGTAKVDSWKSPEPGWRKARCRDQRVPSSS
mmetsp:Transcript_37645/g.68105  ORF Transcript_37645/g.68105 Transcript_37645/m.68105 type:complete len:216 (+) Transcript_37645:136-783(+)